jgi:hypothetical protein
MYHVLIFGASYGSVLGIKLLLAGQQVTLVGTPEESALINAKGLAVRFPLRRSTASTQLTSSALNGRLVATTPEAADPSGADLVVLAMQEPQLRAPELKRLLMRTGAAGTPCLSIMNMPPLPFLARFPSIDVEDCLGCYTDPSVWTGMDPQRLTHCSADPQAGRAPAGASNAIEVRLPTNFRAASFPQEEHNRMLLNIADAIDCASYRQAGVAESIPVKLKVQDSLHVALSKWPMLVTGNYRCITDVGIRSIEEAVHHDLEASRVVYEWVAGVCCAIGARKEDIVAFARYAEAARSLTAPASAARAIDAGAPFIERVDHLVARVAAQKGLRLDTLDQIVARVDARLAINRSRTGQ